ncbi:putative late blight resistance protein homolog r1a-6, partial [Phtheirospermum japonicum]
IEEIGRKIANKCEGLPLAIIEVAKILCKTQRKVESWKEIAESEDPLVITIDDDTHISKTLSLSYKMLPQHLKSCFLYMGGFIEPTSLSKSMERMAEEYLVDLVSRNIVLVCKGSSRGRIKTCRIHFLFRNICISEAQNQKLFHVIKKHPNNFPEGTNRQRGLCFHNNTVLGFKGVHSLMESVSTARSLLCFGPQHQHPLRVYLDFPPLRVVEAVTIRFYKFPLQVIQLVELRFLAITYDGEIPASISGLCNLEVLIVHRHHESLTSRYAHACLHIEIWVLRKLRHLKCMEDGFDGPVNILENLLTLSGVSARSCTRGVLGRMPNLMKLGIRIESLHEAVGTFNSLGDFSYLIRLESFKCVVLNPGFGSQDVSFTPSFPVNIRKTSLMPNLEVQKLRWHAFRGPEWETNGGEFLGLKVLLLEDLDIKQWRAHETGFPPLRRLIIRHCYKLQEIPFDIPTLESLEVDYCDRSSAMWTREINKVVRDSGNKPLKLRFNSSWEDNKRKPKP